MEREEGDEMNDVDEVGLVGFCPLSWVFFGHLLGQPCAVPREGPLRPSWGDLPQSALALKGS
eukprot:3516730-Pyramimonas_sp.AAC.1